MDGGFWTLGMTVDSALSPGAPAGHQVNSAITGKPSTATNWLCLIRTMFRAPHIATISPHKFSSVMLNIKTLAYIIRLS
jgi:hypothetical protein